MVSCAATTAAGAQCRNGPMAGSRYCGPHADQRERSPASRDVGLWLGSVVYVTQRPKVVLGTLDVAHAPDRPSKAGGARVELVAFTRGDPQAARTLGSLPRGAEVVVVGHEQESTWQGQPRPQVVVHDVRVLQPRQGELPKGEVPF